MAKQIRVRMTKLAVGPTTRLEQGVEYTLDEKQATELIKEGAAILVVAPIEDRKLKIDDVETPEKKSGKSDSDEHSEDDKESDKKRGNGRGNK